ncbi:hypothetical protein AAKU55_004112 [Oxalobacteraceae bacterium GrIS 1.11]
MYDMLPGARVVICRDANLWNAGNKNLSWSCGGSGATPIVIKLGWHGKNPDGTPLRDEARQYAPSVAVTLNGAVK